MKKFMIDILLQGLDNETRMKLLPREQEIRECPINCGKQILHTLKL